MGPKSKIDKVQEKWRAPMHIPYISNLGIRGPIKAHASTKVQGLMSVQCIGTYRSNKFPLSVEAQVPPRFFRVYCQFDTEVQRLYGEISCKKNRSIIIRRQYHCILQAPGYRVLAVKSKTLKCNLTQQKLIIFIVVSCILITSKFFSLTNAPFY